MNSIQDLRIMQVEASSKCNARCPMCSRYTATGNIQPKLNETNLTPATFYKFFSTDLCKTLDEVTFSGVFGDPCMNPHLIEFSKYLIDNEVKVIIDSNAGLRSTQWWVELAQTGAFVNFAVDGLEDTNHIYRRGVVWEVVQKNMSAFGAAGGRGRWNFIVFQHNQHQIEQAESMANDWGIEFTAKITQKFRGQKEWKVMENGQLLYYIHPPTITEYRHPNVGDSEHIISLPQSLYDFQKAYNETPLNNVVCQTKVRNELYLTSTGLLLPCCWLGSYAYDILAVSQFTSQYNLSSFDINLFSVEEIFETIKKIYKSTSSSFKDGRLLMCNYICQNNDPSIVLYHHSKLGQVNRHTK